MPVLFDRIVQLDFAFRPGEPAALRLMCEVQGQYANAVLTDPSEGVLLAARQIGEAQSRARSVRVGAQYPLPPPPPGVAPRRDMPLADLVEAMDAYAASTDERAVKALPDALAGAVQGISPDVANELCSSASVSTTDTWGHSSTHARAAVHAGVCDWAARLEDGRFAVTRNPHSGALSVLGAYSEQCESVHECIDTRYRDAQGGERFAVLHARLTQSLLTVEKSLRGRVGAFQKQLNNSEDADATQKLGDMLMANVHRWPPGAPEVDAEDWDTGALLPALSCKSVRPRTSANQSWLLCARVRD